MSSQTLGIMSSNDFPIVFTCEDRPEASECCGDIITGAICNGHSGREQVTETSGRGGHQVGGF